MAEVGRKSEIIYLSLHCHHQNDSCTDSRWAAMESHLNVSVAWEVMDKVTRPCPQTTTFSVKRKESRSGMEPRSFRGLPAYSLTARPNRLESLKLTRQTDDG